MKCNGVESFGLGHASELDADNLLLIPAHAELHGEGNGDRLAHGPKDLGNLGQIPQQPGTTVAADHALGRAAQIQVYGIEACVLNDARGFGQRLRIGAEELRADGVLIVIEGQIAAALGLAHPRQPVR